MQLVCKFLLQKLLGINKDLWYDINMKYFKNIKSNEITFTNLFGLDFFPPKPAVRDVPDWYKDTPEYILDQGKKMITIKENPSVFKLPHTIKKCIPVFDAITAGYILYTQVDVQVSQENESPYFLWADQDAISFHAIEQAPLHPMKNNFPYPKWNNPYAISTPPGYSILFTQPFHRESVFTIFPGVVDTDTYKAPVNFPFVLNDPKWEGVIPAGTAVAQIIPFKRESWKYKMGLKKELDEQYLISKKLKTLFFNSYKKQFWFKKDYR